jgi:hypothetical protein
MPTTLSPRYRASTEVKVDGRDYRSDRIINNYNLNTVLCVYAIVLLITINVILRFPALGALIEQYNQF